VEETEGEEDLLKWGEAPLAEGLVLGRSRCREKERVSGDVKWGAGSCGCSGFVYGQKRGERLPDGWGAAAGCFGGEKSKPGRGRCLEKK